jgi:Txe/YoeB family toxin of Txe-Axe toxin-antitoxin module
MGKVRGWTRRINNRNRTVWEEDNYSGVVEVRKTHDTEYVVQAKNHPYSFTKRFETKKKAMRNARYNIKDGILSYD